MKNQRKKLENRYGQNGYYPQSPQASQPKRSKRLTKPVRVTLLALCAGVLVFSAGALINYGVQNWRSQQTSDTLRQIHEQTTDEPTQAETAEPSIETTAQPTAEAAFAEAEPTAQPTFSARATAYPNNPDFTVSNAVRALQKSNRDIVGWITIPDVLDEAVVQRDNSYYLTHDHLGQKNVTGALFLDEACNLRQVPEKLVIHGHNMKTGRMFGILKKYKLKGLEFLRENYIIQMESTYETAEYVIFAVAEIDTDVSNAHYFDFLSNPIFSSDEDFDAFVNGVKGLSMYSVNLDVQRGDRLLVLATCAGDEETKRLIVVARKIRDDENRTDLKIALYAATQR